MFLMKKRVFPVRNTISNVSNNFAVSLSVLVRSYISEGLSVDKDMSSDFVKAHLASNKARHTGYPSIRYLNSDQSPTLQTGSFNRISYPHILSFQ